MPEESKTALVTDDDDTPASGAWLTLRRTEKVPELIARKIQREIVDRGMKPGDMLPSEAVMLRQLGAGRASVREALRILEIHGLIRIKPGPGGGPMVDEVTSEDYARTMTVFLHSTGATFAELLEARMIMEPVMARLAAARLTDATAERIRAAAQAGWDALDEPAEVWSTVSEEFHAAVASASGNRVVDMFSASLICIHRGRVGPLFPVGHREATCKSHDRIAEAILTGNQARAEQLTRRHIQELVTAIEGWAPAQMSEVIDWR